MKIFCVGIVFAVVMAGCAEDDPVTDGGDAVEEGPTVMIEGEETEVSSLPVVFSNGLEIGRLVEWYEPQDGVMRVWHKTTELQILLTEETGTLIRGYSPNIYRDPECTTPLIQRSCKPQEAFPYVFEHSSDGDSVFKVDRGVAPDNNSPVYLIDGDRGCVSVYVNPDECRWAIEPVDIPLQFALPITIQ